MSAIRRSLIALTIAAGLIALSSGAYAQDGAPTAGTPRVLAADAVLDDNDIIVTPTGRDNSSTPPVASRMIVAIRGSIAALPAPLTDEVEVLVIGDGLGALSVSAGLRRAGVKDIGFVERAGDFDRAAVSQEAFQRECTPSYFSGEGDLTCSNRRNSGYGGGPLAFYKLLAEWPAEGGMAGLDVRHDEARPA